MPEDQGVNGDMWTNEACRLFSKAGWNTICSQNLDIADVSGKKRGLDAIFEYEDGIGNEIHEGVFVEAKRPATTSVSEKLLHEWIIGLSDKIAALRRSPGLLETYPLTKPLHLKTGVIAVWFHDLDNYAEFQQNIDKWLKSLRIPHGRAERDFNLRVFFMDNAKILRLISLFKAVDDWKRAAQAGETRDLAFYYPSSTLRGNPVRELDVVNLEYMHSEFLFAKATSAIPAASSVEITDMVFYFGDVDYKSFQRLASAIQSHNMVNAQNPLVVYKYLRETEDYRKISNDVTSLFEGLGPKKLVGIKNMDASNVLPAWIVDGE